MGYDSGIENEEQTMAWTMLLIINTITAYKTKTIC